MREFTLIMPYFENPGMLARQWGHMLDFRHDVRSRLHLIFCDDCSSDHPIGPECEGWKRENFASVQTFRVEKKVRWNWLICRNIGAHHAKTTWMLMTDIDHLLPEATARRIIEGKLDQNRAYRFKRVDAPDMKPSLDRHGNEKPHPNTWLFTKAAFEKIGGYDERFSGFYGSDGEFKSRVKHFTGEPIILPDVMVRVPREVVPDASTTRYGRKEEQDRTGIADARSKILRHGGRPERLKLPYDRVA